MLLISLSVEIRSERISSAIKLTRNEKGRKIHAADIDRCIWPHFIFLTAVSFYVRDMCFLRVVVIVSCMVVVVYNYFIPEGPLWLVIYWLIVFVALNVVRIANLLLERRSVSLSDRDRELYETNFRNFTPVEFMKLIRLAEWHSAKAGDELAVQGEKLTDLKLVYNGEVERSCATARGLQWRATEHWSAKCRSFKEGRRRPPYAFLDRRGICLGKGRRCARCCCEIRRSIWR